MTGKYYWILKLSVLPHKKRLNCRVTLLRSHSNASANLFIKVMIQLLRSHIYCFMINCDLSSDRTKVITCRVLVHKLCSKLCFKIWNEIDHQLLLSLVTFIHYGFFS